MVFKKLLSDILLQEAVLVFTASTISHKKIKSAGKKSNVYYFQWGTPTIPSFHYVTNNLFRKTLQQNPLSNQEHYLEPNQL